MRLIIALGLAAGLAAGQAVADDVEIDHYRAVPSETLDQALNNFSEYNARIAEIVEKDDLSVADMEKIHEYTYTIEIALAKLNDEMTALAGTLEELHLASEDHVPAEVRRIAEDYLRTAGMLIPSGD